MGSRVAFFEDRLEQLFELLDRVHQLFNHTGAEYRVIGGMAVYMHAETADPDAGRLTRDIDVAVNRTDLPRIAEAAPHFGLDYRHAAGVDMLVDRSHGRDRRGVHFVFVREKVRPEYVEPVPGFSEPAVFHGALVAPVADLVRMKLTSFRLRDQVHIKDLDELGLITGEVEAGLSAFLRDRLAHVRAAE